jgi:hypothetical protein
LRSLQSFPTGTGRAISKIGFAGRELFLTRRSGRSHAAAITNKSDQLTEIMFRGFVQQIKIFAHSQGERTESLTELKGLLEHVLQDTAVIRTKTESLSKSSITTG